MREGGGLGLDGAGRSRNMAVPLLKWLEVTSQDALETVRLLGVSHCVRADLRLRV
jgi:hypothetical protein